MRRGLSTLVGLMAVAFVALPSFAEIRYLTTPSGDYLLDQYGCRLIADMVQTHGVILNSAWPADGIVLSATGVVKDDRSGIAIRGCAYDPAGPMQVTYIQTVDPKGAVKTLATCQGSSQCSFDLAKGAMTPGSNDVWFLATTKAGVKYGATTKMSPP